MIQNILDMKAVTSAGPFLYVVLQEGTTNAQVGLPLNISKACIKSEE